MHDTKKYFYEKECVMLNKKLHDFTSCTPQTFSAPERRWQKRMHIQCLSLLSLQTPLIKTTFDVSHGLRNLKGVEPSNLPKAHLPQLHTPRSKVTRLSMYSQ